MWATDTPANDTELRHKIEGLLEAHERAEGFYANAGVELHTMGSGNSEATLIESPLSEGPGAVIGRYKLLQKVGEGGMGVVYMIRHVTDQVEDMEMPPLKKRNTYSALTPEQVQTLITWINEGAEWPDEVSLEDN